MKYYCLTYMLLCITLAEFALCDNVGASSDEELCKSEIDTEINNLCPQTTSITEMFFNYFNYRDNRIDRDEFKVLVENFCGKILFESQCLLDNVLPIISDACNSSVHSDLMLVQTKYHNIFSQYFCANNQKRYMDTIEDDGINCLFNRKFAECFYKYALPVQQFTSEHICGLLDTNIRCEHHFDDCVNQNIKTYRAELFRLLKQDFNC